MAQLDVRGSTLQSRPISEFRTGSQVNDFLRRRVMPRGPERTEIYPGEIILEVAVFQEAQYGRNWHDIFDDSWKSGSETVKSGCGPLMWQGGGPEFLRSRFDFAYAGSKGPADVAEMFRVFGAIPGFGICLDRQRRRGRIVDLFGVKDEESRWEHLRRLAITLSNPIFINPPGVEHPGAEFVVNFKNDSDLAGWEWEMRSCVDNSSDSPDIKRQVVRPYQNAHDLRTREQLVRSGQVRVKFVNEAQKYQLMRDMQERQKLCREGKLAGNPSDYEFCGFWTPALAGLAEVDLVTHVRGPREI